MGHSRSIYFFHSVATFTAMSSPSSSQGQFFNTPELVGLLAGYLPTSGISKLCQTSRQLRQWSESFLFHTISSMPYNGHHQSIDLFHRLEFLNRLAKYTASVRSLHITIVDKAQLYNGLLIYHHQQTSTTTNNPLPTWLPPLNDPILPLHPLTTHDKPNRARLGFSGPPFAASGSVASESNKNLLYQFS